MVRPILLLLLPVLMLLSGHAAQAQSGGGGSRSGGARATATVSAQIIAPARITADRLRADTVTVGGDSVRVSRGSAHLPANRDHDAIALPLIEFH